MLSQPRIAPGRHLWELSVSRNPSVALTATGISTSATSSTAGDRRILWRSTPGPASTEVRASGELIAPRVDACSTWRLRARWPRVRSWPRRRQLPRAWASPKATSLPVSRLRVRPSTTMTWHFSPTPNARSLTDCRLPLLGEARLSLSGSTRGLGVNRGRWCQRFGR